MKYLVTGACGFIGSNYLQSLLAKGHQVFNIDCQTYAAQHFLHPTSNYTLLPINTNDVLEGVHLARIKEFQPDYLVHFAAESMVDRSLEEMASFSFTRSNVSGTLNLLELMRRVPFTKAVFLSTDEVYGSLPDESAPGFTEQQLLNPSNPYAGTKAAADQLTISYVHNFKLPIVILRPSNNYGPNQHEEKFIPKCIKNFLAKQKIPLYGSGTNIREWTYVQDTCGVIEFLLQHGVSGEVYNFGSGIRVSNLRIIEMLSHLTNIKFTDAYQHVPDRLGHDQAYGLNCRKILKLMRSVGLKPSFLPLDKGLLHTFNASAYEILPNGKSHEPA